MKDFEVASGKFVFQIPGDRLYTQEGLWVLLEDDESHLVLGLSDFVQQSSGDVAFVAVKEPGTLLKKGEEIISLETIKVSASFGSPVSGVVSEANPLLDATAEVINQDPYGKGWLAVLTPDRWEDEKNHLLSPEAYYQQVLRQAAEAS